MLPVLTRNSQPPVPTIVSFEVFYRHEYSSIVALTIAATRDRSFAEDIAQEAFVKALGAWAEVSTFDNPAAWVRRVALNLATSRMRRVAAEARALLRRKSADVRGSQLRHGHRPG